LLPAKEIKEKIDLVKPLFFYNFVRFLATASFATISWLILITKIRCFDLHMNSRELILQHLLIIDSEKETLEIEEYDC
jgi:hypothetical protein